MGLAIIRQHRLQELLLAQLVLTIVTREGERKLSVPTVTTRASSGLICTLAGGKAALGAPLGNRSGCEA
jgi:hypothetical protein